MKKYLILLGVPVIVAIGAVAWLYASSPAAQVAPAPTPTVGSTAATPTVIGINTPTTIALTSVITDPSVIPTGVNLLRINATGNPSILGRLRDDGTSGDAVAGDKTFTAQVTFNEPATGEIKLQVSAAFRGVLRRVLSNVFFIDVQKVFDSPNLGLTFNYPSEFALDIETPEIGEIFTISDIATNPEGGGFDVPLGCSIHLAVEENPGQLPLAQWISKYSRTDGTDAAVLVGGRSGIRKEYVDEITDEPAAFIFVEHENRVYVFSAQESSCLQDLGQLLASVSFE